MLNQDDENERIVLIQHKKNGSGKITFSYGDLDQLDKIIGPFRRKN